MSIQADDKGIVNVPSPYPVAETMDRLEAVVKAKVAVAFIRIDQRREAQKVGLELKPTELLLFGNPQGGTVLMNAVPSIAIDLPLKVLAWEDGNGQVRLSYNSPEYLLKRQRISDELIQNIARMTGLILASRTYGLMRTSERKSSGRSTAVHTSAAGENDVLMTYAGPAARCSIDARISRLHRVKYYSAWLELPLSWFIGF